MWELYQEHIWWLAKAWPMVELLMRQNAVSLLVLCFAC
jgi:hypothetical protein